MKITEEMVSALAVMREYTRVGPPSSQLLQAINTLDNADYFAPIDDAGTARLDVEVLYTIASRPAQGTRIRHYAGMEGYDEDDIVALAKGRLGEELVKVYQLDSADDVQIVKINTSPCV